MLGYSTLMRAPAHTCVRAVLRHAAWSRLLTTCAGTESRAGFLREYRDGPDWFTCLSRPRGNDARSTNRPDAYESVRALRAGVVINAGVDLGPRGLVDMSPASAAKVPLSRMGARGLFVRIEHGDGLISLYAHLGHYSVEVGDWVDRGERIGDVGRTGVQTSDAHLHLGIFEQDRVVDPLALLAPYVIFVEASP